jgi:mannose-1-phosphate guanylyltransferase/mannose-6-phosphate isomerase
MLFWWLIYRAQDVQKAVDALKAKNATQASAFLKDHQSHLHRAEHWIIVKGTAEVSVDETVHKLHEKHSIFMPVGAKYRIKNLTKDSNGFD